MRKEKVVIVEIEFNTERQANYTRRLSKEWIKYRINIFMNYTLQSLINQTNQSFYCFMYYDEKTEDIVKEEIERYPKLPSNIIISSKSSEAMYPYISEYSKLYLVKVDCDDMYHPSYIQQMVDYKEKTGTQVLANKNGYVYDIFNDKLGEWPHKSSPFYTLIYDVESFISGYRHPLKGGHTGILSLSYEYIEKYNYVVTIHDKNVLNTFERHSIRVIEEDEKDKIIKDFNIRKKENMI
ncbi:MAG: glycosyltransferase [Peptostreptococcaceae bacterium]